jgi:hypothetical protein
VVHEPDDTIDVAQALPTLPCVSAPLDQQGCLAAGDPANWYAMTTPSPCGPLQLDVIVTYPLAFEALDVEVWQGTTMVAAAAACTTPTSAAGSEARCVTTRAITAGTAYGILVKPNGRDCKGACNYNRYDVSVQLSTAR